MSFAALVLPHPFEVAGGTRPSFFFRAYLPSKKFFTRQAHAHPAADAERGQAAARFSLQHFVEQRHRDAGPGAADGMAERNSATVDVESFAIEMQLAIACQHLGGEGFIQFNQIEVAETEAVF